MLTLNFNPFPVLTTERLVLRKLSQTDKEEMFFLRSDERVMKYIGRPRAKTVEEASAFIDKICDLIKNNESIFWAINLKESPKMIGTICVWNITREHYRAEIGYNLHPDYHGKGIMQEAIGVVSHYAFHTMNLHSIEAQVHARNEASIKVLEKSKFVKEAYFRENFFFNGKFSDTVIYSKLSDIPADTE